MNDSIERVAASTDGQELADSPDQVTGHTDGHQEGQPFRRDPVVKPEDAEPACCGSGCAVCVLDCADDYWKPAHSRTATGNEERSMSDDPRVLECCNTGCLVCVLDYPDEYRGKSVADLEKMFEAVENAERQLQMISEGRTV